MEDRLPRKLAAILYADVAGYSRLTGEDEDATHRTLGEYLDFIATTIQSHRGQVMHYAGDAVLAKFDAVLDAVSSAVTIQSELNARNHDVHDGGKLQFRIGVNLGDVIEDRGDIYGDGVNIAARLESLAQPGGICISDSVRTALGNKLPLELECMGEQDVKNIAEPVKAFRTAIQQNSERVETEMPQKSVESPDKPSIVVLPFSNMNDDPEQEYFVDGITEEIITGLGRFREIIVVARGSSFLFKGQSLDPVEVASKLGVEYVLEGSVRKAGNRVRITTKLIEGKRGHQICSERYDRELDDIFAVQDDVSQRLVAMLAGQLEENSRARALRTNTNNLSAYDYWLRGKHYLGDWKGSKDEIVRAREMFERAIELDPGYAAAHAGLAGAYLVEFEKGWTTSPEAIGERALELARKAVTLDERDSWARFVLAIAYRDVKSNFELADAQVRTAIELNPNHYWNYCFKGWLSTCAGDLEEGIACGNEAIRRNPLLPDGCLYSMVFAEYLSGRYELAIETFGKMSHPDPECDACLAACYAQLGRDDEARRAAHDFRKRAGEKVKKAESWHAYWSSRLKFKDPAALEHLLEGMRKAGLSEQPTAEQATSNLVTTSPESSR